MQEQLHQLREEALVQIAKASDEQALMDLEKTYFGKKGALTKLLKGLKDLPIEEKKIIGKLTNDLKQDLHQAIESKAQELKRGQYENLGKEFFDTSMPGMKPRVGRLHPLTKFIQEIEDTFIAMNFEVAEGPEVEDDYHNFTALNIPEDHPA